MNPQMILILLGGGVLAWYFLGQDDTAAASTEPGATGKAPNPTPATPGNTSTGPVNTTPTTTPTPTNKTLAQRLAEMAGTNSASLDVWNYWYQQYQRSLHADAPANTFEQPAPEDYLPA